MDEFKNYAPLYEALYESLYYEIPILDIGDRVGDTDYIDFIKSDEMKYPVMRGVDKFNRPFLSIKMDKKHIDDPKFNSEVVATIFQRYTYQSYTWCIGTCYTFGLLYPYAHLNLNLNSDSDMKYRLTELFFGRIIRSIDMKNDQLYNIREGSGEWVLKLST